MSEPMIHGRLQWMTTVKNTSKVEEDSKDIKASKAAVMWRRQPTTI